MPTIISGTNGIDQVQSGVITPEDLNTAVNPAAQRIQTFTAQASTAGTSIDFTGIPTWAKEITVMFNGVSTNGTSSLRVLLGTTSGFETSGYLGSANATTGAVGTASLTNGFDFGPTGAAATRHGQLVISNLSTNLYVVFGGLGDGSAAVMTTIAASKTLAGILDRIRITTVNGTDTFDAGSINILVKG